MGTSNSVKYKAMATKAPPFKPFWINLRYSQFVVLHGYCEFSCIFSIVSSLVWCFNSKFCHKHFMLKHNKLKHLFYTNICWVSKQKKFFSLLCALPQSRKTVSRFILYVYAAVFIKSFSNTIILSFFQIQREEE